MSQPAYDALALGSDGGESAGSVSPARSTTAAGRRFAMALDPSVPAPRHVTSRGGGPSGSRTASGR
jgi:hypothetical protein